MSFLRSARRCAPHAALACALVLLLTDVGSQPHVGQRKDVSFEILEDYDKGDDLDEVALDFVLMRELGVTTWRGSLGWDDFEPSRGHYDFAWLEQFIERAAREGIMLRPYVAYTPEWAAAGGRDGEAWNDPPRSLEAWTEFVARLTVLLAKHPNVLSLEIYNEQNVPQWWEGTVDQFVPLLERAITAASRHAPRLMLLPGGLVYPDAAWIERVCNSTLIRAGINAVALHAYPETWTPPEVTVESYLSDGYAGFLEAADTACGRKPIWINEAGFATTPGRSEHEQADWWARAFATFLAAPHVEHVGIYEIKDLSTGKPAIGDAPNYHLGLTYADRRRKLAFATVGLLTDLLDTGTLTVADDRLHVDAPEGVDPRLIQRHLFLRPDGRQVLFVWSRGDDEVRVTIRSGLGGSTATEYHLDGTSSEPVALPGGTLEGVALKPGTVRIFVIQGG